MTQARCFHFPFSDFRPDLQKLLGLTALSERGSKGECFVLQNLP